jgi:D-3-phosphoglycerate dehydrogenase
MTDLKILVADKLSDKGLAYLAAQDGVTVDSRPGLSEEELASIVGEYDGMIIRSGAKVTANVLAEPGRLKAIARAGVGVDNIDVTVASEKGVLVMNTPDGNTISTAELTVTLMMALSRKIAPASASLREGKWERKLFQGTQLAGKTLGVIGMGRIGRAVANRAAALQMNVLAYDPHVLFVSKDPAIQVVTSLDDLCSQVDYLTVHVPRTPETIGMIGAVQIALMKPTARLINAARGGVIDEAALADALDAGKLGGAALDVYTAEPPISEVHRRLIDNPNVLAVPHLGASTAEAQEQVAIDAACQLVDMLRGVEVRNAINAPGFGGHMPEELRPYLELARRMGLILGGITDGAIREVDVVYRGPISAMNVAPATTCLLAGLLEKAIDEPVNVVNAPVLASQRGVEVETTTAEHSETFTNLLEVTVRTDQGERFLAGTVLGKSLLRVMQLDGFRIELEPAGNVAILFNQDMPGVIGQYGKIFGEAGINIANMTVARREDDGAAVGVNLDTAPDESVVDALLGIEAVSEARILSLPPRSDSWQ